MSLFYIKETNMENIGEIFSTIAIVIFIVIMVVNNA